MKYLFFIFLLNITLVRSQIEAPEESVRFESPEKNSEEPSGLELPATKPSLSNFEKNPATSTDLKEEKELLDITKGDGLLDYKSDMVPKAFSKDKEAKKEYGSDQNLGDLKTGSVFVNVKYRDHEYVDGDRIRVFVNEDIVQSDISLGGSFQGFKLPLQQGFNKVEFQALNQGSSGPNTAELHVYDDNGLLISAKEWNLLTGSKATILIIKE